MKKKRIKILFLAMILAFAIAGCNDKNKVDKEVSGDVSENETVTEKEETQKTDNKKDDTTTNKNESTSNKNETTTKPSTGNTDSNKKPSTGSTGNSGSTNGGSTGNTQNNNGGTTTQPSAPVHEHKWTEVVKEEIHYYAWRTICNVCKKDMTDMTADDMTYHVVVVCGGSYANYYKEVDFVTENIVKNPVVTGYKCECGATKGK